jgi:chromosome partitioning protein
MPVIAVINRKGGSGKSTMATHLAAWLAHQDMSVMLGDVDRQQSTRAWLKRRNTSLPAIVPWALDQKNVLKVPAGVTHVVLDTPGGMHGFELARVVMSADAIIMPVCNSMFDRESAAACHAELQTLPRVASGRCKLGVIGMRLDARTKAAETLKAWATNLGVPFVGVLRETQMYVKCLDSGLTLFDARAVTVADDLQQWEPILNWLRPVLNLNPVAKATLQAPQPVPVPEATERMLSGHVASLTPAQGSMLHGERLTVLATNRVPAPEQALQLPQARSANPLNRNSVPRFLLRH